ncbi:phosphatidylserine/phosphatidylglycerophosphate/cardiolipin synthase-like enzyme [Amorphus suaedae]
MPQSRTSETSKAEPAPLGFGPAYPHRSVGDVRPLIEASAAYPEMERLVIGATRTAHLSFRIFDPATKTRSEEAVERNLTDWGDVLIDAAERGVQVRVLLADFEPVLAHELHRVGWSNGLRLLDRAGELSDDCPGSIDLLIALHEGELGPAVRSALWPAVRIKLNKLLSSNPEAHTSPGIRYNILEGRPRVLSPMRMWPATHHQKMLVVDGEAAVVGGIDVDERRYDDPEHSLPAAETWHDVSLRVDGVVARDVDRHFIGLWNREVTRYGGGGDLVAGLHLPPGHDHQKVPNLIPGGRPEAVANEPDLLPTDARIRLVRTGSVVREGPFAISPMPVVAEIEAAFIDAIRGAHRLIYIENQFFRLRRIAEEIGRRVAAQPDLEVIVVLPMAPDMVAFERKTGPDMRFGEWLQVKALRRLLKLSGDRVGLFSMVGRTPAEPGLKGRARAFGSGIVYPHSKVLIVDDARAIVGSANINGRSFRMDTELALDWTNDERIRDFRDALFSGHLGDAYRPETASPLELWKSVATENLGVEPEDRSGFVVPYKLGAAARFARFQRFIPEVYL